MNAIVLIFNHFHISVRLSILCCNVGSVFYLVLALDCLQVNQTLICSGLDDLSDPLIILFPFFLLRLGKYQVSSVLALVACSGMLPLPVVTATTLSASRP